MRYTRLRKGTFAEKPATLAYGEMYVCTDTSQIFIGNSQGSLVEVGVSNTLKQKINENSSGLSTLQTNVQNKYFKKEGGELTGSPVIKNNVAYQSKNSQGLATDLIRLNGNNQVVLGYSGMEIPVVIYKGNTAFQVYHGANKPSPSDIGASPSNHNHNGTYLKQVIGATNESYVLDKKFIEIGDSSTKVHVGRGSTDVYVQNTVSNKYFALKDDGRLLYNDMNVTLDDPNTVLWRGYHHMIKSETVTPSKPLNHCSRGWVLVWSDWDDGVAGGNNYNINYSYIPKNTMFNTGTNTCFALSCGESANGFASKTLYIFNDRITGHDSNKDKANNPNSYDIVLRAVLEY